MKAAKLQGKALFLGALLLVCQGPAQGGRGVRLPGHVPHKAMRHSHEIGHHDIRATLHLAFALKPHDEEGLADFVKRVQDPADPLYQRYLTPDELRDRFLPTAAEVSDVVNYLRANGFTVTQVHPNHLVIDATADARTVERAFQIELDEFAAPDGRRVLAPNDDPLVSESVASRLHAIAGLSNFRRWKTHSHHKHAVPNSNPFVSSYMTPAKIKSAYNLSTLASAGSGETLALFELDGYDPSDISTYASQFSITAPALQNVLVDGYDGSANDAQDEVCLDIELAMAVSPGLSKIMVYEGPNTDSGVLDTYSRIANDNIAKTVSTSWGSPEDGDSASFLNAENTIFQQMAAQGQSVFAASGDAGAFDDSDAPATLQVDDPGSQPYVTSVGGTTLSLVAGNYASESSWGVASDGEGGGGGVSTYWAIPSWQARLAAIANKGSYTQRMVPDVSVNSNPSTGYLIFTEGHWYAIGGTSAAAPIWAAFMAQVNQARVAASLARIGFANAPLYQVGQSSLYGSTFHDIHDGSTNLFFPAVTGYDLSTGLGSFQGTSLLNALSAGTLPPYPPSTVTTQDGSHNGEVLISWNAATGATSYQVYRSTSLNGTYVQVYNGGGTSFTDTVNASSYYYYVVASNGAGSSAASAKRAGAYHLAAPAAAAGLSGSGAP